MVKPIHMTNRLSASIKGAGESLNSNVNCQLDEIFTAILVTTLMKIN